MSDLYLSVTDASNYLSVKKSFMYSLVERREIPHYRLGRLVRFKHSDLDDWIEKRRVERADSPKDIRQILRSIKDGQQDIDEVVKKSIAEIKINRYTPNHGRPN